tara:strand:+ start:368 stop:961 length:594 start_codon:yes stop_codon:yes gene_type:complete
MTDNGLTATLEAIRDDTEQGEQINVEELMGALNSRGYGPLLIGPALITVLPTGAIPGVPAISALLIIFVSVQILFKKKQPWIPTRFKDASFSRKKFVNGLEKVKPYTKKIDSLFYPRMQFLVRHEIQPLIALLCILMSICIIILGWIPFLAMLPASGILLLGLGLSAKDGLMVSISIAIMLGSLYALFTMWSSIFGA